MPTVKATFTGETSGFEAATKRLEVIAKANAVKITDSYKKQISAVGGHVAANEMMLHRAGAGFTHGGIAGRGGVGGNRKLNFATAGSMFTSVARDSAASLASGAPITQVIAQQAPQVLQALAMMRAGTLAWAAVVAGAGVFAWHKLTQAMANAFYGAEKFKAVNEYLTHQKEELKKIRYGLEEVQWAERDAAAEAVKREKDLNASIKERTASYRDLEKAKLRVKNTQEVQQGILTPEQAERKAIEQQIGFVKEDLAGFNAQGPMLNPDELRLQNELEKLKRKPQNETFYQQQIREGKIAGVEKDIGLAKQKYGMSWQTQKNNLETELVNLEADLQASYKGWTAKDKKRSSQKSGLVASTEWERAGGFMAGPQVALLEVNRGQLNKLTSIEALLRQGARPGGVKF